MGLIGVLVVTTAPTGSGATAGTAYPAAAAITTTAAAPAVSYNAEIPVEFSEVDPVQNKTVDLAVRTAGFKETRVWVGTPIDQNTGLAGCGYPNSTTYLTCYPPAVNYTPFYFLINGLAFDKANVAPSAFPATAGVTTGTPPLPATTGIPTTGTVLVRLVNAGVRMHVPSIVGSLTQGFTGAGVPATESGFTVIAEDGNPVPNLAAPRVQTDVFMAAGKTFDVMVNVPALPTGATATPALPIYDRELSLSANSSVRDAGMLAYISVNNANPAAGLPVASGTGVFAAATANPDTYNSIFPCGSSSTTCSPLTITDPSKGVIANDVNVYGVELSVPPANGNLTCAAVPGTPVAGICANGTFTYTPLPGWSSPDTSHYCANGAAGGHIRMCATVTLAASALTGPPVANAMTFTSKMATFIKIPSPGVLSVDSDPASLPLTVDLTCAIAPTLTGGTLVMDPNGGFTASVTGSGTTACPATALTGSNCFSFSYRAQNTQGSTSTAAVVTLVFPPPSNLQVKVLDAQLYNNCNGNSACISAIGPITDYRWIIEEDKTFWVDPNCTTNSQHYHARVAPPLWVLRAKAPSPPSA